MSPSIAVLPGDGIGVEVTAAAVAVLERVLPNATFASADVGARALDTVGDAYPDATHALCERSDAILFGAVGDPRYDAAPANARPEFAILELRRRFDLFANLRPAKMLPGLEDASTLKPEFVRDLDLLVVRETTSGLYFGQPKRTAVVDGVTTAIDTLVYRVPEIERVARIAFELARTRRGRVTSVDKQNVLESGRLWRKTVIALHAAEYADVELDHLLVDSAAMELVRRPTRFDVMLTENTFGDILSDQAGMLTGSLGNLPSATLGSRSDGPRRFGLYEPISGSAPDIAGKGIANPIAAILSAALLCRYSLADETAATRIERAVASAIAGGARTRDIARGDEAALGTDAFAERVLSELTP